eukprot:tig00021433_g21291.t1
MLCFVEGCFFSGVDAGRRMKPVRLAPLGPPRSPAPAAAARSPAPAAAAHAPAAAGAPAPGSVFDAAIDDAGSPQVIIDVDDAELAPGVASSLGLAPPSSPAGPDVDAAAGPPPSSPS